jgi:hypothetical protein
MSMRSLKLAALLAALALSIPARGVESSGTFFAVIVDDVDVSAVWYSSVLDLHVANRMTEPGSYDIVILENDSLVVELLELDSAVDRPEGRVMGPFKSGFFVDDLAGFVAGLPDDLPPPEILDDDTNGLLLIQLRDPDDNIIQVMQRNSTRQPR